ncbi:MAG: hypothetical protein IKR05_07345 [Prevotella sp.]|nr:hypothetical protein [Prevotella sp.]
MFNIKNATIRGDSAVLQCHPATVHSGRDSLHPRHKGHLPSSQAVPPSTALPHHHCVATVPGGFAAGPPPSGLKRPSVLEDLTLVYDHIYRVDDMP